jgi:hypothetical protein
MQCDFTDCSSEASGGALFVSTDGLLVIDTCYFSGNSAAAGGALRLSTIGDVRDKPVLFNIIRSVFENNSANINGNAIYTTSGILSLTHSTVRNHVYKQHQVVFTTAAITVVSDSLFHDNVGAAIQTNGKRGVQLIVERSDFINNTAPDTSSAIQAQEASLYLNEVRVQVNHNV